MAEEEFEIDVYGDDAGQEHDGHAHQSGDGVGQDHAGRNYEEGSYSANGTSSRDYPNNDDYHDGRDNMDDGHDQRSPTPPQRPQQGVKRKENPSDERPVDPGATSALIISDLQWWNTDDDVRGWVREAGCEEELKDISFSEHKVNGKSKGQVYLEFTSQQAATAVKHLMDSPSEDADGQAVQRKHSAVYSNPHNNPFRTLPKDNPNRAGREGQNRTPSGPNHQDRNNSHAGGYYGSGYRGGRGSFNGPRGGGMNSGGFNRNFTGNNMSSFNNNMGFNNPMAGGGFGGGGFNRGGMMGGMRGGPNMRGGRGGMGGGMMGGGMMGGGMPMGGMGGPMGAPMGGPMGGMGMMGGGMPGFQGMQPPFNPGFFNGGGQPNEWQNPHGAKRARGE